MKDHENKDKDKEIHNHYNHHDDNSILEVMGRLLYHNFYQYFIKLEIIRKSEQEYYNDNRIFLP